MSEIKRILEVGCHGDDVKMIQNLFGVEETGVYDNNTKKLIEEYQINSMQNVTGKVLPSDFYKLVHHCISSCTDESLDELDKEQKK